MACRSVLNVEKMLTGSLGRLRNIKRFSNSFRVSEESVAEHSFYTTFYAMLIAQDLARFTDGPRPNILMALQKAIVHDVEESHSGDFIRMFKHSCPDLKRAIDRAGEVFAGKVFSELSKGDALNLAEYWRTAKNEKLSGRIVSLADFLSVLAYVGGECRRGNRAILEDSRDSLKEYMRKFSGTSYDPLRIYVKASQKFLSNLLSGGSR